MAESMVESPIEPLTVLACNVNMWSLSRVGRLIRFDRFNREVSIGAGVRLRRLLVDSGGGELTFGCCCFLSIVAGDNGLSLNVLNAAFTFYLI